MAPPVGTMTGSKAGVAMRSVGWEGGGQEKEIQEVRRMALPLKPGLVQYATRRDRRLNVRLYPVVLGPFAAGALIVSSEVS